MKNKTEELQSDLNSANEAYRRLETEKSMIVESLNDTRDLNKELQDRLKSLKVSCSNMIFFCQFSICTMLTFENVPNHENVCEPIGIFCCFVKE